MRLAWFDDFMRSAPTKKNRVQPFWYFGTPRGSAFGPVMEATWTKCGTRYQVKVPRPFLARSHQGYPYPDPKGGDHMVITAATAEAGRIKEYFLEILNVDTIAYDYTIFHDYHLYDDPNEFDQKKVTLRRLKGWLGESLVLNQLALDQLAECDDPLDVPAEATLLLEESRSISKDLLTSLMMSWAMQSLRRLMIS